MKSILAVIAACSFLSSESLADGIDCSKTTTEIERQICANRDIWWLDKLMADHYLGALLRSDGNDKQLKRDQRSWIKNTRDKCKNIECLENVYEKRISYLMRWKFTDPYCGSITYPPYPAVWGIDLSKDNKSGHANIYKVPTGEAWIVYRGNDQYRTTCFFSGKVLNSGEPPYKYIAYRQKSSLVPNQIRLRDGGTLSLQFDMDGPRCDSGYAAHLVKRTPDGEIEKQISILSLLDKPVERYVNSDCEGAQGKSFVTERIQMTDPGKFIELDDGTLLVANISRGRPYVLRLDRNLNLNADFHSDQILIVDYSEIDRAYLETSNYQELADYIYKSITTKFH